MTESGMEAVFVVLDQEHGWEADAMTDKNVTAKVLNEALIEIVARRDASATLPIDSDAIWHRYANAESVLSELLAEIEATR